MHGKHLFRRGPESSGRGGRAARIAVTLLLIVLLVMPTGAALAAGPATNVAFDSEDQTKTVGESVIVTVMVTDSSGDPVSGETVSFQVDGSNTTAGTKQSGTDGQASFTYSGSNAGLDTVTASIGADAPSGSDTLTVEWIPEPDRTISLTPSDATSIVSSERTMTATVKDASGQSISGAEVTFTVDGMNPGGDTDTTSGAGKATFTYTGTHAGTDNITASVADGNDGTVSDAASIHWVQPNISLDPKTATNAIAVTQTMTATVTDNAGVLLKDIPVRFEVSGTNSHSATWITGSDGKATFNYSSAETGIDTVTVYPDTNQNSARDNGEPKETATILWNTNPATGLTLSQPSETAIAGTPHTLTVTVRDLSGELSSGVMIRFAVSGANPTSGDRTTNSDGIATFTYTGADTGKDTVEAYADVNENGSQETGESSASGTVNWVSNVPSSLALTAESDSPVIGSSDTFTATVKNAGGDLLPGVMVRFSVSGANSESGNSDSDNDGQATFSYSGANAGDDTIDAYADTNGNGSRDSEEPSSTVKVTWSAASQSPGHFGPADPAPANPSCTFYHETEHNLCGGFRDYWNKFGGLAVYGYPITEEFQENGITTQYFERARFEWHPGSWPERYDVLLGLAGNSVTASRSGEAPFQPAGANGGCTYYSETRHNLCGGFRDYWNNFGGLAVYGFPISEEFAERNPDDGQIYTVQYFERGRFEWHPGAWPARYDVMLGRLGAQVLQSKHGVAS